MSRNAGGRSATPGRSPQARLAEGLARLGLDTRLSAPLEQYLAQLSKWNAAYNLTAVRDPQEMVTRHLLDSLAVLPVIERELPLLATAPRLLDVGSGAGLPGIPLALARPGWRVSVLDSNGKKARFLRHVQRTLNLSNVEVIEARAEQWQPAQRFDLIVSRAFSALGEFLRQTRHLIASEGCWLAMKGRLDENERRGLPDTVGPSEVLKLDVPGLREERHLILVRPAPALPEGLLTYE
jgi:16S rRNA (guanine527-N7)-methyltransferase